MCILHDSLKCNALVWCTILRDKSFSDKAERTLTPLFSLLLLTIPRAVHGWPCALQEILLHSFSSSSSSSAVSTPPLPSCPTHPPVHPFIVVHLVSLVSASTDSFSVTVSIAYSPGVCPSLLCVSLSFLSLPLSLSLSLLLCLSPFCSLPGSVDLLEAE